MSKIDKNRPFNFHDQGVTSIYFLKEGRVKLFRLHEDGREVILDIPGPGEIFGELTLSGEGSPQDFASALDSVLIITEPGCETCERAIGIPRGIQPGGLPHTVWGER